MFRIHIHRGLRLCSRGYSYSTSGPAVGSSPPLLAKFREDMKTAMREKDSARLDVIRGLLSDFTNATKSSKQSPTDSHILQLIRKRIKSSENAAEEAQKAEREDLRGKELQQVALLRSYITDSDIMGEDDVRIAVQQVIGEMRTGSKKTDKGSVMKALLGPEGALDGQLVDKQAVAKMVDGML